MNKFKKTLNYLLYFLILIILFLGYWGFVKIYGLQFPIYNYKILDWLSAIGIFSVIFSVIIRMDKYIKELLEIK